MDATQLQATTINAPPPTSPVAPVIAKQILEKPKEEVLREVKTDIKEAVPGEVKPIEEKKPENTEVTKRFAALARKEEQIVQKANQERQKLAEEKKLIEQEKAQIQPIRQRIQEEDSLWEINPLEVMKRHGWDYDKLTKLVLNGEKPTADILAKQAAKKELEAYKKQQQEEKEKESNTLAEKQKEEAKQRFEKTLAEYRQGTDDFIKEHAEKYELINFHEATEVVLATIEEHYQRTKKAGKAEIMSRETACDLVEKFLEDKMDKAVALKKVSAKVSPKPAEANGQSKPPAPVQTRTQTTINNNMTTSATTNRALTRDERIKRALAVGKPS